MLKHSLLLCAMVVLSSLPVVLQAQTPQPKTAFLKQATANAIKSYQDEVGMQALLYNGSEYKVENKPYLDGHAYFDSKTFEQGAIVYDGVLFTNVPLLYDVVLDEVITVHPVSGLSQKLVKHKVSAFNLPNYSFVHLKPEDVDAKVLKPGLYSLLYDGKTKVLLRREKSVQEHATVDGMEGKYKGSDKFYIQKDGAFYQVGSKGTVLNVFRDQKKQLKKFMREKGINYSSSREAALVKIAEHYDSLKN